MPLRLFRTPGVGEVMVKGLDLFKRGSSSGRGLHRERLTPRSSTPTASVHPAGPSRTPILVFPREIPVDRRGSGLAMTTEIEQRMKQHFRSKPVHIMWAMKDPAFLPTYLDNLWLDTFPDARSPSSRTPAITYRRTRTSASCPS